MRLTDEMKEMVERLRLCYVATVTPDGKPNLSPKGSLKVWDDETVVFADIASPGTMRNLRSNPFIEINLVDPFLRRGFRFKGRAEICESGPEFDFVAEALWSREGRQYPGQRGGEGDDRTGASSPLPSLHVQRQGERGRS
jgi:predicted pyridoxine 5'-phosphate oxidase superfamily flavin-nucleotide-binding protein